MKKLIAQRPIQYMGRTYERGEAIPAQDPKMVAAWLKANSAAWTGTDVEDAARAAIREAARRSRVNDQAAEAIRAMGVTIEDTAGEFVGASSMEEQIRALFAPGGLQNGGGTGEGQDHRKNDLLHTFDQTAGELLFLGVSGEELWARVRALEGGETND